MRTMTRLQKLLSYEEVDRKGSEGLFEDFPQILEDIQFADSVYDRIRKDLHLRTEKTKTLSIVVEHDILTFSNGALEIRLDLPILLSLWLPLSYETHLPKEEENYEKEEVLAEAIATLCEILGYLKERLEKTPMHALQESWKLVLANKGLDGNVQQTRKWLDKTYRIKFQAGRKPIPTERSGKQAVIKLYKELMVILEPGFDKNNKSVTKIKAICDAVDRAGISDSDRQVTDELWNRRSAKQVAIYITAKRLNTSESTVKRYLK